MLYIFATLSAAYRTSYRVDSQWQVNDAVGRIWNDADVSRQYYPMTDKKDWEKPQNLHHYVRTSTTIPVKPCPNASLEPYHHANLYGY